LDLLKESVSTERRKTKKKIAFWVLDPLSPRVDCTERRKTRRKKENVPNQNSSGIKKGFHRG